MSKPNRPPQSPHAQQTQPPAQKTAFERWVEDWRRRPRFYVTVLLTLAVVVAGGLIIYRRVRSAERDERAELATKLQDAAGEQEAEIRLERMETLRESFAGTPHEPTFLLELARQYQGAARQASEQAQKTRWYEQARQTYEELIARFPNNPLVVRPHRPAVPGNPPPPSIPEAALEAVKAQLAFLQAHPYELRDKPVEGLRATLTLEDPEGESHALKLAFFPQVAPDQVDSFLHLAREGALAGTLAYAVERERQAEGPGEVGTVLLGSAMSKVAPDAADLWGDPQKDTVGFTVPGRRNHLARSKGRVGAIWDARAFGTSPFRFAIYTKEAAQPDRRVVFAEVVEGEEVLDQLAGMELRDTEGSQAQGTPLKAQKPWKISGISVEGTIPEEHRPVAPVRLEPRLPEPPEVEEPEDVPEDDPPPQTPDTRPSDEGDNG